MLVELEGGGATVFNLHSPFGDLPPGITVVNSWYWRSAHWTLEQEYFFEVEATDEIAQELVSSESLHKLDNSENLSGSLRFHNNPEWFAPKPLGDYDIYIYAKETSGASGHFIILVDRESGRIFISDCQIWPLQMQKVRHHSPTWCKNR